MTNMKLISKGKEVKGNVLIFDGQMNGQTETDRRTDNVITIGHHLVAGL